MENAAKTQAQIEIERIRNLQAQINIMLEGIEDQAPGMDEAQTANLHRIWANLKDVAYIAARI